ncbi:MAG: nucleotidyltransferase domain-containing protein [Candidatus Margulisbacteria bacterium]|jgi:predicted nucleotidyltransferase|nr:nucleotidyltransferase domain-containing protein [Candidatus Margulisiibacteriota bacterium]
MGQLDRQALNLIRAVFAKYPQVGQAMLFGSRAKGTARYNSDIDIALRGVIDWQGSALIADDLNELPLPYKFDVLVYDQITNPDLRAHIDRVGKMLYIKQ